MLLEMGTERKVSKLGTSIVHLCEIAYHLHIYGMQMAHHNHDDLCHTVNDLGLYVMIALHFVNFFK